MTIKETILRLPAWKAGVYLMLFIFFCSAMIEEVMMHTIFHVFDRAISAMEIDKKSDLADLNDMDQDEQNDFCEKYKLLLEEKADLAKRSPSEFSYDFAYGTMKDHEQAIQFAMQQHYFNLARCQQELKRHV